MKVQLREFQKKLVSDIYEAWESGATNVMAVAPTGSGKTVVLSLVMAQEQGASIAIAHRQELVSQISTALARNGVRHKIIGSNQALIRSINAIHTVELGYSYFDANSKVAVGGVDTILRMGDSDPYFKQVQLMVQDESHHVLRKNKWGKVASFFPNARGLLPTATPTRADGKGLGRHADGIVDVMVQAPTMRELINMGYLTDYRLIPPPNNFDRSKIPVGANGELNQEAASNAVRKAQIVGDIVGHYLKWARGKLGVTFAVDVEEAIKITKSFKDAGVPAEIITAKTPDYLRAELLRKFKNREILMLVNVDLFGEGFDLPALEVVIFARPTASFSLFSQQWGRVLRLLIPDQYKANYDNYDNATRKAIIACSEKPYGMIIDHVGNSGFHGLPDKYREWSLDRRESRASSQSTAIPLRICANKELKLGCGLAYERIYKSCPYCGCPVSPPAPGSDIEYVDGDLTEISAEELARLRGEIDSEMKVPYGAPPEVVGRLRRLHGERKEARDDLKDAIAWWAGLKYHEGYGESESYRLFYFKFGVDVATAQTLTRKEMCDLAERIRKELDKRGVNYV